MTQTRIRVLQLSCDTSKEVCLAYTHISVTLCLAMRKMASVCILSFSTVSAKQLVINKKTSAYKSFSRKKIQPFSKGILDHAFICKSAGIFAMLSQPVLSDVSQTSCGFTLSVSSLSLAVNAVLPLINKLYDAKLTSTDITIRFDINDSSFCRDPMKEKSVLLRLALGDNKVSFLPFSDNMPIADGVVEEPLENGCVFFLSDEAIGSTISDHTIRHAYGLNAMEKFAVEMMEVRQGIPRLISCRVETLRKIGSTNLKEWMSLPNSVYIGRRGSVFIDNRRFPDVSSPYAEEKDEDHEDYRKDLLEKVANNKLSLTDLKGKTLGCWCSSEKCHGDVIIEEYIKQAYSAMFHL